MTTEDLMSKSTKLRIVFAAAGVAPEWDLKDIILGMMQFMVIKLMGLALIFMLPQIALWFPTYIYGQ